MFLHYISAECLEIINIYDGHGIQKRQT